MKKYIILMIFCIVSFLLIFSCSFQTYCIDKEKENMSDPECLIINDHCTYIYKSGVAIKLQNIQKFNISNPWFNQYSVNGWIGWNYYTIKSGFSSREDAETWMKLFLKQCD